MSDVAVMKNYMETLVEREVDSVIKGAGGCNCDKCRLDVMAAALNTLPPKYVVAPKGMLYSKLALLQNQFSADLISAIAVAVEKVKKAPRHE